ncbi:hypothetical protein GE061_013544 [Apolygus lucorum]|uniref:Uncharacterized protein n=1 Tax=Apolygus lucorum TaxID=248454 RepID=A0A6A4K0P4_APOLU|nr:hypothetical protein GE061_013544 [Apolygus lucorum]
MSQGEGSWQSTQDILEETRRRTMTRCPGCGREFVSINGHCARAITCARTRDRLQNAIITGALNDEVSNGSLSTDISLPADNQVFAKLEDVYCDSFINGPGREEANNAVWRCYWRKISQLRGRHYDLPNGSKSMQFVDTLASEITSLTAGQFSSERVLVFLSVVLQRSKMIKQPKDIRILLGRRLQLWTEGQFDTLINEAVLLDRKLNHNQRTHGYCPELAFHRLLLRGKAREAVGRLSENSRMSVLGPTEVIDMQGKTVLEDLMEKHPDQTIPDIDMLQLPAGMNLPPLIDIQISSSIVERVSRKLHGSGGPGGSEADQWVDFLLRHGRSSCRLR